jgi:hypothetical protein
MATAAKAAARVAAWVGLRPAVPGAMVRQSMMEVAVALVAVPAAVLAARAAREGPV